MYKGARKPTLKELGDVIEKHELKLVGVEFPSSNMEEKSVQISRDEMEFCINNHLHLAEVEKTLAVTYGEIKGALDTAQAASSSDLHHMP